MLSVLAGTNRPLTGREVARLAGRASHSGALEALNRLTEHGLVDRQEAGRALLYTLNRDHLATPAVEALANLRGELIQRLQQAFADWVPAPVHASVFGSVARGDGDTTSDVDLFIVRPAGVSDDDDRWREQVDTLAIRVKRWSGNRMSVAEVGGDELPRLGREEPPILAELAADAVTLAGPAPATLFGASG